MLSSALSFMRPTSRRARRTRRTRVKPAAVRAEARPAIQLATAGGTCIIYGDHVPESDPGAGRFGRGRHGRRAGVSRIAPHAQCPSPSETPGSSWIPLEAGVLDGMHLAR